MKFLRASHQAHQVDFHDLAKAIHLELGAFVEHRALRLHENVKPIEWKARRFDRLRGADVELGIVKAVEVGAVIFAIVGRQGAGAADMHDCAMGAKGLRDAVADPARAAHHQNGLAAKIKFVH